MRRAFGGVAVAVVFACLVAAAPAGAAVSVPDNKRQADRWLNRAMNKLIARDDGPLGAIAVVQRRGKLKVHRVGEAEVGSGVAPRKRMHMRIASTAKAFSGYVALSQVADGELSLNDTIGDVLPSLPVAWHGVTVAELLHHTGGVPDFTNSPGFGPAVNANPLNPPPPVDLLSFVWDKPLGPSAGSFLYSNTDNVIIGLMAAEVSQDAYENELAARVTKPLGLGRTYLRSAPKLDRPTVHGYQLGSPEPEDVTDVVDFGGWAWASGGIVSTPGNLNRFIRSYIRDYARIDEGLIPGAHSEPRGPGKNAAGMAVFRYETSCGTVYGHTGSILGYTQFMAATANGRRSVTFSINTQYTDTLLPRLRKAQERAVCAALA